LENIGRRVAFGVRASRNLEEQMDKKVAGLVGVVAGLATMGGAQAATPAAGEPTEPLHASSYADLLAPIANPVELLKADNAARAQKLAAAMSGERQVAQAYSPYAYPYPPYAYHHHHHHHHHHNAYWGPPNNHHHHHHHHNSTFIGIPGVGGVVVNGR
jgi:hypothetical protein